MRWPLVSRRRHEAELGRLEERAAAVAAELGRYRRRHGELESRIAHAGPGSDVDRASDETVQVHRPYLERRRLDDERRAGP